MFARLTILQVQVKKIDETIRIFEESIIPTTKKQKGYREAYLLTDPKTGKCLAISLWDREEDAVANERSGYYKDKIDKMVPFFTIAALAPIHEGYQVSAQG